MCACVCVYIPIGPRILLHSFPGMVLEETAEVLTDKGLSEDTGDTLEVVGLALSAAPDRTAASSDRLVFTPNTQGEGSLAPPPTHDSIPNDVLPLPVQSLSAWEEVVFGVEFPTWTGPKGWYTPSLLVAIDDSVVLRSGYRKDREWSFNIGKKLSC